MGDLFRLLLALGQPPGTAQEIAEAIDDWRRPGDEGSAFDGDYMAQVPSFRAPHASFQEIEELLLVKGITPDIVLRNLHPGRPDRPAGSPRLVPRAGLINCLSVYGFDGRVDVNTASPAVLAAVGLPQFAIDALVAATPVQPAGVDDFLSSSA